MTAAEERTHFAIWAICKSPIILGTDVTKLSSATLALVKNKVCFATLVTHRNLYTDSTCLLQGLLAVNQDSLGKAAATFTPSGQAKPVNGQLYPYWAGPLSDGVVVALVAPNGAQSLSVNFADVPGLGSGSWSWTELLSGQTGSGSSVSASLGSHDVAVYRVTKSGGGSSSAPPKSSSSGSPTPATKVPPTTSEAPSQPTGGSCAAMYAQCGGSGWTGATTCCSGSTCKKSNDCKSATAYSLGAP